MTLEFAAVMIVCLVTVLFINYAMSEVRRANEAARTLKLTSMALRLRYWIQGIENKGYSSSAKDIMIASAIQMVGEEFKATPEEAQDAYHLYLTKYKD